MESNSSQSFGCLFCRSKANSFLKEEHVIPESLGNVELILKGVVCDKCNAYFSDLENYFVHYHLTSSVRLLSLEKTKKGKPPAQILEKGQARKLENGKIRYQQAIIPGKEAEQLSITFYSEDIVIKGSYPLPDADGKKLSRALGKFGLETLFLKKGDLAFDKDFDGIRTYARYGEGPKFVPFIWNYQNKTNSSLLLTEMTHKTAGVFFLATIFVPGSVYFIPLHRFDETLPLDKLVELYSMKSVMNPGNLKRESPQFEVKLSSNNDGNQPLHGS